MESLKELYKIGSGPSSSHTMGPKKAAEQFAARGNRADAFRVTLYGSLAATGKGHLTDVAILSVLQPIAPTEIVWRPETVLPFHPNGMLFEAPREGPAIDNWTTFTVGGGALATEDTVREEPRSPYPPTTIADTKQRSSREAKSSG